MITKRLIVCLDVLAGRVVKGTRFVELREHGNPATLAARYEAAGADELVFLDIGAGPEARATMLDVIRETAERLFVPLTVGGGLRSIEDVGAALRAGADKVGINSAAIERPELIAEVADRFGAQCLVVSIDAARRDGRWRVFSQGGRRDTGLDAVEWAVDAAARGAGELLITSIDRDGSQAGYDLELTRAVVDRVTVPVIASGGAGGGDDVVAALRAGGADAALVAGILHEGRSTVAELKAAMLAAGIATRRTE